MSRMAKRYQGLRAELMLKILMEEENAKESQNLNQPSTSTNSRTLNYPLSINESEEKLCSPQIPERRRTIRRSTSLSVPKIKNSVSQRRCSSVPPSITIVYCKPSITYNHNPSSHINDESGTSCDADFSGADSDTTFCPSDADERSDSSLDIREEPQEELSTSSGIFHGNINEGRKRKYKSDPSQWKKNKNKKLRMSGKEYLGYTKLKNRKMEHDKIRPARKLGERCNSEFCKKSKERNCDKLNDETRLEIHKSFWQNMNWDQRKVYVNGLVTRKSTTRKTSNEQSRREGTFFYYLPTADGERLQVCRTTFLNTLCLGSYTVQSWVKKARCNIVPSQEIQNLTRVKTPRSGTQRKISTATKFLDNIPKLPSHYARKDSSKLYLEPTYRSLSELYSRYKECCCENDEPIVCRFTFERLFKEKSLSLYTLKKDMCDTCSGHAVGNISTAVYDQHIKSKNRARQEKVDDKKKASNGEFILLSMDLESVKVCPYLTASALYFKTKLTCHNYTVYDLVTHQASCYWYDETGADLTASTFASFLIDYLKRFCLPKGLPIVIYSDGCTYQNRNNILANALLNLSVEHNTIITQKYLIPGHTQMECDSVHAAIERKLKNREIHVPSDYIAVTKEARKKPTPYEAIHVDHSFVKDYSDKSTFRYSTIRPGRKANDPVVVDLRALKYSPNGTIAYKLNFEDEWAELPVRPKSVGAVNYSPLHAAPIPISSTKFNHLQQLKEVLPRDCHLFYDNIPHL